MKTIKYYELEITIRNKKLQEILGNDWLLVNFETLERMGKYITDMFNLLKDDFHLKNCVMWSDMGEKTSFNENTLNCANFVLDNGNILGISLTARQRKIYITE